MKKLDKKDQQLNAIFAEYIEEGKMPSKNVTLAAKDYLNKEYATEDVLATATATTNNHGLNHSLNNLKNRKLFYLAAFIVCAFLIAFGSYFITKSSLDSVQSAGLNLISLDQLDEKYQEYKEKDFLPFINNSDVKTYSEYNLKENLGSYNSGDTIAYFIKYNIESNFDVSLYVENKSIYIIELADYKNSKNNETINQITFFYNFKDDKYLYYFSYKNYGYNLTIDGVAKSTIDNYLTYISSSLKK